MDDCGHPRPDRPHRGGDRSQLRDRLRRGGGAGPARRGGHAGRPRPRPRRRRAGPAAVRGAGRRRRAGPARPGRPQLGPGLRGRLRPGRARPAGQQRRRDGGAAAAHAGRVREPVRHQPPRPLRADRAAAAQAAGPARRPGGHGDQPAPQDRPDRLRRPDARGRYRKWPAYAQSKLANLLFTFELQRRADAAGVELLALSAHPGYAATNLQTAGPQLAGTRSWSGPARW